jgi:hypothetical protein
MRFTLLALIVGVMPWEPSVAISKQHGTHSIVEQRRCIGSFTCHVRVACSCVMNGQIIASTNVTFQTPPSAPYDKEALCTSIGYGASSTPCNASCAICEDGTTTVDEKTM